MSKTITEVFDLPSREEITALGFVVRLESKASDETTRRLVDDYVLTPAVRQELPVILRGMRNTWQRGEELGRFVHGSFGSGKSHFESYVGLLLDDDELAWGKPDPLLRELEKEFRPFVREAKLLTVRVNMLMSQEGGFDRALYDGFNRALELRGKAPFEFLHVEGVLEEARTEAEQYGSAFWVNLANAGVVGSKDDFDELAGGTLEEREALAKSYLEFKGRDPASAGINPNWADGLQRLTRHAKSQGFGGVVFLIDELLLWLSGKDAKDFRLAINQLNVMVDHADGARALPLFVFVARQRNISEFFPDMVQDNELHQHLDHHSKRFEVTTLQDVELRHICRERILKRRDAAEIQAVVDRLAEDQKKLLPTLLQNADLDYLRDVYPFHPALIEMLIDVSSLMQRERTALRLLYELLVVHYPDLQLGKFLPVAKAFDAIFPESGIEGSKRVSELKAIHALYYQRFRPAIAKMAQDAAAAGSGFNEGRRYVLEQLVKTALLAKISPRLEAGGITVERLVLLNDAEVKGETDRGRMSFAHNDLVELSRLVPALQLTGSGRTAVVGIVLQGANFGEILNRARSKADNPNARFRTFLGLFEDVTGLSKLPGFRDGKHEGPLEVRWRNTSRKGYVRIANVRELSNADFRTAEGEAFRLLIDYPWDDTGHTVEEDRQRARDVRKREGSMMTACWLPRHFTESELGLLVDFAATQNLAPADRSQVVEQANNLAVNIRSQLKDKLRTIYMSAGIAEALLGDVNADIPHPELDKNLAHFASLLLDRKYPQHPGFEVEPRPADLELLCDWLVSAAEAGEESTPYPEDRAKVLRGLGGPGALDLVELGQMRGRLKRDGRYLKAVLDRITGESVRWDDVDLHLEDKYGMPQAVRNFFLAFVARAYSFRLVRDLSGEQLEPVVDNKPRVNVQLKRATLLDIAEWSVMRDLGPALLGVAKPSSHRTLVEQDRAAGALREAANDRREALSALHEELVQLGVSGGRNEAIQDGIRRLAVLVQAGLDSHARLKGFLAQWPAEVGDEVRAAVLHAADWKSALERIDTTARNALVHGRNHATLGPQVDDHLKALDSLLGGHGPLTAKALDEWNGQAKKLMVELVGRPGEPTKKPVIENRGPTDPPKGEEAHAVFARHPVNLGDGDALNDFWRDLRSKLQALGIGEAELDVTVREAKRSE
mgnify:CR=1 FL=1